MYLFAWSVVGLAFVMYFGYASFVVLKTVCALCLLTYVSVIGIFILSGSGTDLSMLTLFAASFLGVIVGVPLIILTRNRHYPVPLGTLLAASAFAATFLGQPIIDWYTHLYW